MGSRHLLFDHVKVCWNVGQWQTDKCHGLLFIQQISGHAALRTSPHFQELVCCVQYDVGVKLNAKLMGIMLKSHCGLILIITSRPIYRKVTSVLKCRKKKRMNVLSLCRIYIYVICHF